MACPSGLSFFAREQKFLKVFGFNASENDALVEKTGETFPLPTPKTAAWSPDGRALALVDSSQGVLVVEVLDDAQDATLCSLSGSPKTVQSMWWSPLASALVTVAPAVKGSQEPNVHVWRRASSGSSWNVEASFCHPKLERDKRVLEWTGDESLCGRLCSDGRIHIVNGDQVGGTPLVELALSHPVQSFEFAPLRPNGGFMARLAVFVPDCRDDLQRVIGPATVSIWDLVTGGPESTAAGSQLQAQECVSVPVASGQVSDLAWSATGTALLAHCQTEVDESGQSYYGGSRLVLVSHNGQCKKDLTNTEEGLTNGGTVQAVAWSPTRDEFILIHGFQPAQASLFSWDQKGQRVTLAKVLLEKAHRNTIRFNHFGSLVCLAGFGNLAGGIDFFGRGEEDVCDYVRVASCQANCTVSAEWAPDGRHFLTAVLAPRMRVDNATIIWQALSGTKVSAMQFEELYDAQWRPEPASSSRFRDVSLDEVNRASKELASKTSGEGGEKKRQAYRPPKARGDGASTVAAMMRGEVAAPDGDDKRLRKPRVTRQKDEEFGAGDAPVQTEENREGEPERSAASRENALHRQAPPAEGVPPVTRIGERSAPQTREAISAPTSAKAVASQRNSSGGAGYPSSPTGQPAPAPTPPPPNSVRAAMQASSQSPQSAFQVDKSSGLASLSRQPGKMHGASQPCPTTGWQYVDPRKNIQGPFALVEMQHWNSMGYFRPDLPMRCDPSDPFVPFAELYPHPMIPFQSYPNRPGKR